MYGYAYSMQAFATIVSELSLLDAEIIASRLTWDDSEFQAEVLSRKSSTPLAIVRTGQERVAAWVASHRWRDMQTAEGFTHPALRRRGLSRLATCLLLSGGFLKTSETLAVFSPKCVSMAASLGFGDVRLYERQGKEWVLQP